MCCSSGLLFSLASNTLSPLLSQCKLQTSHLARGCHGDLLFSKGDLSLTVTICGGMDVTACDSTVSVLVSALPWGLSTSYRGGNLLSLQTLLCLTALFSLLVKMLCHTPGNSPLYLVRLFSGSLCYDLNLTKHLPTMSTGPQAPFPFPRATVLIRVLRIPTGLALRDLCKGLSCLCSLSHHPQHWSPSCNLYDLSPQIKIQAHALKRGVRV